MRFLLIVFVALFTTALFGQTNWIKGDAVWHYSYSNFSSGWVKLWTAGDTLLQNKMCTKLNATKHEVITTGPDGNQIEVESDYIKGIVFFENDTLYYWDQGHFSILYDFKAATGDQWILQQSSTSAFGCNDTSFCQVDLADSILIDGHYYKQFHLSPAVDAGAQVSGPVNARFGASVNYLLPFGKSCDGTIIEFDQIALVCFQDDSLYYNPAGQACEFYLGIEQLKTDEIVVTPNPVSQYLNISSHDPIQFVEVFSMFGNLELRIDLATITAVIDVSNLMSGNYYIKLHFLNGEMKMQKIQVLQD
jgi:hypothetical protein